MFIVTTQAPPQRRSEERDELAFNTHDASRSSERRRRGGLQSYKHVTPNGVKNADVLVSKIIDSTISC